MGLGGGNTVRYSYLTFDPGLKTFLVLGRDSYRPRYSIPYLDLLQRREAARRQPLDPRLYIAEGEETINSIRSILLQYCPEVDSCLRSSISVSLHQQLLIIDTLLQLIMTLV